jgi:hypothetical protein
MGSKSFVKYRCDLCRWDSKDFDSEHEAKADGWVEVSYEGRFIDRDFQTAWVCPYCVKKVVKAANKDD